MTFPPCICAPDYGTPDAPTLDVDDDCPRHREGGPAGNPRGTEAAGLRAQIAAGLALHYRDNWGDCADCRDSRTATPPAVGLPWPCPTVLALGGAPMPSSPWGTCYKHGAPVPCSDCHALVTRNGGHPLVVRRFTCTTCQLPVKVRQYRDADLSVAHVDPLLAVCQHAPTAPPEP